MIEHTGMGMECTIVGEGDEVSSISVVDDQDKVACRQCMCCLTGHVVTPSLVEIARSAAFDFRFDRGMGTDTGAAPSVR